VSSNHPSGLQSIVRAVPRLSLAAGLAFTLSGCVGTIIDTTTDAAIAVAKIPFKVGGAVIDTATGGSTDKDHK
jgi:hypothetical protein